VCCLSSLNWDRADEWFMLDGFVEDALRFLDNVLERFIRQTEGMRGFERARYAASRERSVGLGMMGFHSYLQSHGIAFESEVAKHINVKVWSWLKDEADEANLALAIERGPCPDGIDAGVDMRFSNMFSVAPTASISIIASGPSPCGEPSTANAYTQKTLAGSHLVKNPALDKVLRSIGEDRYTKAGLTEEMEAQWLEDQWSSIITSGGSVQHLPYLDENLKMVFRTAFEIDQRWVVDHAADRQPFICQSQSTNLFLPANIDVKDLNAIHVRAYDAGLKSLYYCRSLSVQRAEVVSHIAGEMPTSTGAPEPIVTGTINFTAQEPTGAACDISGASCESCE
jgi:ribonucleoside-diphosphate reductase alpha chain